MRERKKERQSARVREIYFKYSAHGAGEGSWVGGEEKGLRGGEGGRGEGGGRKGEGAGM